MRREPKGILALNWMGKDDALIPVENGKYDYAWVDPADPRAREVKSIEIIDTVGDADGPTGAGENLLIVGDSGDALRSLGSIPEYAQRYLGKVKLVYIDPPFNTDQTFDNYVDQLEHSIWLTMMRDRIRDIKPLLADDSSVWVHLDDAEVHRMRCLLDEEFGAENAIATVVWKRRNDPRNTAPHLSMDHDTILVYSKDKAACTFNPLARTAAMDSAYTNPDNDDRGPWRRSDMAARNEYSKGLYPIRTPGGREIDGPPSGSYWRISEEEMQRLDADNRIYWGPDGNSRPYIKRFLSEVQAGRVPSTVWSPEEVGFVRNGKEETRALVGDVFATPKPEKLIQRIVQIASNPGDLILDCFAGSGTTAAVAHKLGRRWVTVELQPKNVGEFVLPRLRKVALGDDPGGITKTVERVEVAELPDEISPENAQEFTTWLGKFAEDNAVGVNLAKATATRVRALAKSEESPLNEIESKTLLSLLRKLGKEAADGVTVDVMPLALRNLRAAAKTKDVTTVNWSGGGGFTVAQIGPSMYEVDDEDGTDYLSTAATNGAWSKAVAGQLKFTLTPDDAVFCGVRNRQQLAVIDGIVDEVVVQTVVECLTDGELAMIVGKAVLPEAAALLKELSPGSRIRKAPDQMFPKMTVK